MTMVTRDIFEALAEAELRLQRPRSQRDCVAMSARINVTVYGADACAQRFEAAALGMAIGLFGDAFSTASSAQRETWVRLCREELRRAINDFGGI